MDRIANLKERAKNGNPYAMEKLGNIYYYGEVGVRRNFKKAFKWYLKATEVNKSLGHCMYSVGYMYEMGQGTSKDYDMAVKWYEKAINAGSTYAISDLIDVKIEMSIEKEFNDKFEKDKSCLEEQLLQLTKEVSEYEHKIESMLDIISDITQSKRKRETEEELCVVCMEKEKDRLFLPCNHMCCCSDCAENIRKCPLCRVRLTRKHKVYR